MVFWLSRLFNFFAAFFPYPYRSLPVLQLLLITALAFLPNAVEQLLGCFEFVYVLLALVGGELAFEGVFEHGLAVNFELFAGGF